MERMSLLGQARCRFSLPGSANRRLSRDTRCHTGCKIIRFKFQWHFGETGTDKRGDDKKREAAKWPSIKIIGDRSQISEPRLQVTTLKSVQISSLIADLNWNSWRKENGWQSVVRSFDPKWFQFYRCIFIAFLYEIKLFLWKKYVFM